MVIDRRTFLKNSLKAFPLLSTATSLFPTSAKANVKNYILCIHCDGGWDQSLVFDSKIGSSYFSQEPGAAEKVYADEAQTIIGDTQLKHVSHPNRPSVDRFFEQNFEKSLIINGIYCQAINHGDALRATTAYVKSDSESIDWLSFIASKASSNLQIPHIQFDTPCFFSPYSIHSFQSSLSAAQGDQESNEQNTTEDLAALDKYLDWSLHSFSTKFKSGSYDRLKANMIKNAHIRNSMLNKIIDAYQFNAEDNKFIKESKLAINLFKKGVSQCASIQYQGLKAWDSHKNNYDQQSQLYEGLFSDLLRIIDDIKANQLEDKVTIIIKSELGRFPRLNQQEGKHHWPYTSALIWSPITKGNCTIGKTDDAGRGIKINPNFGTTSGGGLEFLNLNQIYAALAFLNNLRSKEIAADVKPAYVIVKK